MSLISGGGDYLEMAPAITKRVVGRAPAEGEYAMPTGCPPFPSQELCHLVLPRCWISLGISRGVVIWNFYSLLCVLVGKR